MNALIVFWVLFAKDWKDPRVNNLGRMQVGGGADLKCFTVLPSKKKKKVTVKSKTA